MDKALPARTETSVFPSELSRASVSTSKAAWGSQNTLLFIDSFGHLRYDGGTEITLGLFQDTNSTVASCLNRAWFMRVQLEKRMMDLPSHTILCWHGKKWMSKASSEQTRHSVGTATLETLRLVIVLGVVCTRRRLQVMAELSEETCCSLQSCTWNKIWATCSRSSFSNHITLYWSLENTSWRAGDAQVAKTFELSLLWWDQLKSNGWDSDWIYLKRKEKAGMTDIYPSWNCSFGGVFLGCVIQSQ